MHRHVRRIRDQVSLGVEQRAGKIEPLLDVHRVGGVLQAQPHLLRDRHVQVVEDLEHDGIDARADRARRAPRRHSFENEVVEAGNRGAPFRLDHGRRIRLGDDRRSVDGVPRPEILAPVERRPVPAAAAEHAHPFGDLGFAARRHGLFLMHLADGDRLHRNRFRDERSARHQEGEPLAVRRLEVAQHVGARAKVHHERGIRSLILEMHAPHDVHPVGSDPLLHQLLARFACERFGELFEIAALETRFDRTASHRHLIGKAHAVRRKHARVRMNEARHGERVGDKARMLTRRTAKAAKRVARDVMAALHRDVLDRVRHVAHGDLDEAFGDLLRGAPVLDFVRELGEPAFHGRNVERLVAVRPEHLREVRGLDLAEHHVGVGHRKGPPRR